MAKTRARVVVLGGRVPAGASCVVCAVPHGAPPGRELRPYGPGGAWICYPCMKTTPAGEETARTELARKLLSSEEFGRMVRETGKRRQ
jgi:hypothetical protein